MSESVEIKQKKVTSGGVVIGIAEAPQFAENDAGLAAATAQLGVAKVVNRLNAQILTDEMNRVRAEATGTMTQAQQQAEAMALIAKDWADRLRTVVGDPDAYIRLFEEAKEEVKRRFEERKAARLAQNQADAAKLPDDE